MISSLDAKIFLSPVGIAILKRFIPGLRDEDIHLIQSLLSEVTKDGQKLSIGQIMEDPIVAKLINTYNFKDNSNDLLNLANSFCKCPSCDYVDKLSSFAPNLLKGVKNG